MFMTTNNANRTRARDRLDDEDYIVANATEFRWNLGRNPRTRLSGSELTLDLAVAKAGQAMQSVSGYFVGQRAIIYAVAMPRQCYVGVVGVDGVLVRSER